jgi:hypothetical protein
VIGIERANKSDRYPIKSLKLLILAHKLMKFKNIPYNFENMLFSNKKINIKDSIFIAGSPRSGTTWFMNLMMPLPDYTALFEPVNPIWFPEAFKVGFKSRTYLPIDKEWPEGEKYLHKTFSGKVISTIPPYEPNLEVIMRRLIANKLIIKEVRLNRMLPWITKRFKLRGVFFIIRHPCAVISSQLKTGFFGYHPLYPPYKDTCPTLEDILEEASKIDDLDSNIIKKLGKISTVEEILAASWSLDSYIPLTSSRPTPWKTVIYEKLMKDGEKEIRSYFNEIGEKKIPRTTLKNLRKPSWLTIKKEVGNVKKVDLQLSKWKNSLSEKQIERILRVVSYFGLDFYSDDIEPDYDQLLNWP